MLKELGFEGVIFEARVFVIFSVSVFLSPACLGAASSFFDLSIPAFSVSSSGTPISLLLFLLSAVNLPVLLHPSALHLICTGPKQLWHLFL